MRLFQPVCTMLGALAIGVSATMSTVSAQNQMIGGTIKAINTQCDAIQNAVMALKPTHVVKQSTTWKVVSDAQFMAATPVKRSITLADVYRQGNRYAWVVMHSFDSNGVQTARQLCYRQSDGTLQRAKQAAAVSTLSTAGAETGWYDSRGRLIQATTKYARNDPMAVISIEKLPFFNVLPKM